MKIKNNQIRIIWSVILNSLFIFIGVNMLLDNPSYGILIILVLVVVLGFNIHYDYLKIKLNKVMAMIANADNANDIYEEITKIKSKDRLKGLQDSFVIPEILLSLDDNNPKLTLDLISSNMDFLKSKPDYLLIYRFATFKAFSLIGNSSKTLEAYNELILLKESNFKSKHMSLLFNWDEIYGINLMTLKKWKQAESVLNSINTNYFNNRELIQLNNELRLVYNRLGRIAEEKKCITKIKSINAKSAFLR